MTMFLSNRDVCPTGYELCEFLDSPAFVPVTAPISDTHDRGDEYRADDERGVSKRAGA